MAAAGLGRTCAGGSVPGRLWLSGVRRAWPVSGFSMIAKIPRAQRTQSLRDHGIWACRGERRY
jgi:hypothetical protein